MSDPTCIDLSEKLFSVASTLEAREQFFERLRTQFVEVVLGDASNEEMQMMVAGPSTAVAEVFMTSLSKVLDKTPFDPMASIKTLLAVLPWSEYKKNM